MLQKLLFLLFLFNFLSACLKFLLSQESALPLVTQAVHSGTCVIVGYTVLLRSIVQFPFRVLE